MYSRTYTLYRLCARKIEGDGSLLNNRADDVGRLIVNATNLDNTLHMISVMSSRILNLIHLLV
jgi:hypothetical protein